MNSEIENFLWYVSAERRLSPNTEDAYRRDLLAWNQCPGVDVEAKNPPSVEDIVSALEDFEGKGMGPATTLRRKVSFRMFARFRMLSDPKWEQVIKALPLQKVDEKFPKSLTKEEIKQFLDFKELADSRSLRNKALLHLLYSSGLRVTEVTELEWTHIDDRIGGVRVMGKGGKERFVPFTEECGTSLEDYRSGPWNEWSAKTPKRFKNRVFLSPWNRPLTRMTVWKIVRERSLGVGLDPIHPHVLRHSFATHLMQGGADVRFVQALMGHTHLDATEKYLKVTDLELHEVFKKHHPLFNKSP